MSAVEGPRKIVVPDCFSTLKQAQETKRLVEHGGYPPLQELVDVGCLVHILQDPSFLSGIKTGEVVLESIPFDDSSGDKALSIIMEKLPGIFQAKLYWPFQSQVKHPTPTSDEQKATATTFGPSIALVLVGPDARSHWERAVSDISKSPTETVTQGDKKSKIPDIQAISPETFVQALRGFRSQVLDNYWKYRFDSSRNDGLQPSTTQYYTPNVFYY